MFTSSGPMEILSHSIAEFVRQIPSIREGSEEGVHRSRVAIRRMRESLALVRDDYDADALTAVEQQLASAFRALGRTRDADVAQALVQGVERRFPLAPSVIGHLRASLAATQVTTRRKLIKKVESLELDRIDRTLRRARRPRHLRNGRQWRTVLRDHVIGRAIDVQHSLERVGGVYFPNRAHAARVTIKQLRYAVELAGATGAWQPRRGLKPLRRAQESLGDAHDHELLIARVDDLVVDGAELNPREVSGMQQFLRGAAAARHATFLATRGGVADICAVCRAWPEHGHRRIAMLAAGLTLPALLLLRRR